MWSLTSYRKELPDPDRTKSGFILWKQTESGE